MSDTDLPVVWLLGPTAVGKSQVALQLAEHIPVELVSVDSTQVYRGLDVGSAKPSTAERAQVTHHLIDIRDPADPYSAAHFVADAEQAIADIHQRGRIPLLVGGTMLYFKALKEGLAKLPAASPQVRARLTREAEARGWDALHRSLAEVDPETAARTRCRLPVRAWTSNARSTRGTNPPRQPAAGTACVGSPCPHRDPAERPPQPPGRPPSTPLEGPSVWPHAPRPNRASPGHRTPPQRHARRGADR